MKVDKADCSMTCRTEEAGSSLRRTRRRVEVGHEVMTNKDIGGK